MEPSIDQEPIENKPNKFKDKEFRKVYIREYMQTHYSCLLPCEFCGKEVKRYSMSKHTRSKDCKIAVLENLLINSVNS